MPKRERPVPWAATERSKTEAYPRRQVYFIGDDLEDVYDYIIWRANVKGYETLEGLRARSSTEMLNDILRRAYLRDMLDDSTSDAFSEWRLEQYKKAGIAHKAGDLSSLSARTVGGSVKGRANKDARLTAFLRTHSPLSKPIKLAIWDSQQGRCAICHRERDLRIVQRVSERLPRRTAAVADYVAACEACRKKYRENLHLLKKRKTASR